MILCCTVTIVVTLLVLPFRLTYETLECAENAGKYACGQEAAEHHMKIELALVKPEATHYGCDISGKILESSQPLGAPEGLS